MVYNFINVFTPLNIPKGYMGANANEERFLDTITFVSPQLVAKTKQQKNLYDSNER